jgi:hypothetical protein
VTIKDGLWSVLWTWHELLFTVKTISANMRFRSGAQEGRQAAIMARQTSIDDARWPKRVV